MAKEDTQFRPGERRVGRVKGTPNKTTATAKAAIQSVYDRLQEGHPDPHGHFADWARDNPADFYTKVYPRLLPVQVDATVAMDEDAAAALLAAKRRIDDA